ncbi:MAG TPA: tetratricopeptide repeat protein [Pyrinomonadaceae bacterium]|nr:tetratricopeptide repeat protein [Pyrinomonadaceae bacterium]
MSLRHNACLKQNFSFIAFVCLFLSSFVTAHAQGGGIDTAGTGGRHSINGRILAPSGQRADLRFKVKLESPGYGDLSVLSDLNGNFSFQSLRPGNYTVVIDGGDFYETVRESVFIEPASVTGRRVGGMVPISRPFTVQVYLRPKQPTSGKPGVLNAALANVPAAAVESYNRGLESARQGNGEKAIEHLKQAVAIHPGFGLAYNELGVQYLKIGQLDKATDALAMAVKLSPNAYEPSLNYGIALLNQMKFTQAEQHLRVAMKKNETAFAPHLYLGMALVNLKRYQEAETELQKAVTLGGERAARAHYFLGGIYWRARDYQRAANELERYLQLDPKVTNAEQIRATIKDLRNKS